MSPRRRPRTDGPSSLDERGRSKRRALRLGAVALAGSVSGCVSGVLDGEEGGENSSGDPETTADASAGESDDTTHALGVDTSLPEESVEFPEGPKSRPDRPDDLTAESVETYVEAFERRWVYNELYRGESSAVHQECGVKSVTAYGEGFRVVAWCSAWVNFGEGETTVHGDYFTQHATYYVGPDSTVRREGKPGTRA